MSEDEVFVVEEPSPDPDVAVVEDGADTVLVEEPRDEGGLAITEEGTENILLVDESGPPGKPGAPGSPGSPGPPGPPGPPGGAMYVHVQAMLSSVWSVDHNLGRHPGVFVEDAAGTALYGTVQYLDDNALTITFANTVTGRANCS